MTRGNITHSPGDKQMRGDKTNVGELILMLNTFSKTWRIEGSSYGAKQRSFYFSTNR